MTTTRKTARVLLVDDDETFRRVMSTELSRRGYLVTTAESGQAALAQAPRADLDAILLDLRLPDMDGIDVLKKLREAEVRGGVIVLTGHGTIDTAIQATRLGAYDYLEKPCPLDRVEMAIQKAQEHVRLVERQRVLEDGYSSPDVGAQLVGRSPAFHKMMQAIERIAPTESTTLILGETGVGKEMVARLIHSRSRRSDRPFVVVDCAAIHENLLQSELFGHEKGAFTGAARLKHGLFEVAHSGTAFLDEVGEMSPEVQAKLLRVLETGRFRHVGGTREIGVDVRVVSATNRNLREAVAKGQFREDLYFRLAPLAIEIPPLRERPEDVRALIDHFVAKSNVRYSRERRFSPEAMVALVGYRWPGNVRELIHVLEQIMILSDGDVMGIEDLPPQLTAAGAATESIDLPLREVERRHVLSVMERTGGNRARAAQLLQISLRNLYRLLKKYGEAARHVPASPSDSAQSD